MWDTATAEQRVRGKADLKAARLVAPLAEQRVCGKAVMKAETMVEPMAAMMVASMVAWKVAATAASKEMR